MAGKGTLWIKLSQASRAGHEAASGIPKIRAVNSLQVRIGPKRLKGAVQK